MVQRILHMTERFQDVYEPTDLASFFQPFQLDEVCTIYQAVYPKVVQSESLNGQQRRSDEEAREAADKVLKKSIPGTLLDCPIQLPTEKTLEAADAFLARLPDTFLATVYATLVFCTTNLQQSLATLTSALQNAAAAKQEGFLDICSKEQAEEKRKQKEASQCTLQEELTPEQKEQLEQQTKERIQKKMKLLMDTYTTWRNQTLATTEDRIKAMKPEYERTKLAKDMLDKQVKEAGQEVPDEMQENQQAVSEKFGTLDAAYNQLQTTRTNLLQTTDSLVKTCQTILPKLDTVKKNLEAGNYSTSALEAFETYFQSPLR